MGAAPLSPLSLWRVRECVILVSSLLWHEHVWNWVLVFQRHVSATSMVVFETVFTPWVVDPACPGFFIVLDRNPWVMIEALIVVDCTEENLFGSIQYRLCTKFPRSNSWGAMVSRSSCRKQSLLFCWHVG